MKERLEGLARAAARRPGRTVAVTLLLALAGGLLALGLKPSAGTDTFVSRSSDTFQATERDHRLFGSDPIVILVREPLTDLVETADLARLSYLEACLAGQYLVPSEQLHAFAPAPPGAHAAYGGPNSPCGHLAQARPVQVVYGPGTFLNRAVAAVNLQIQGLLRAAQSQIQQAGDAARQLALARGLSRRLAERDAAAARQLESQQVTTRLEQLYLNSGISGTPRIDDPQFIPEIVFDQIKGVNQPKSRFSYLFPTASSALIQVRLKAGLSDDQQAQAIGWIRQAVKMPQFRSAYGGTYTVTGSPVVVQDLADHLSSSVAGLLGAAVLVMALVLLTVFTRRGPRLLPLGVALVAAGITFGLLWLVGGTLTMGSVAVLPILIGLAVDYAIQFQSRLAEARRAPGREEAAGASGAGARAAAAGAPAIAIAALATATGFLVLLLSPVPMVRGFGLLLVVGVGVALLCALTIVPAVAVLSERARWPSVWLAAVRGAEEIMAAAARPLRGRLPTGVPGRALGAAIRRPERFLAVAAVLAVLGWVADTQTGVQSDVTKLVPSDLPALQDLRQLERVTGVSGEIDVLVHARNVATPQVVGWMLSLENRLQSHFGYVELRGCAKATLCPALSLPDLFRGGTQSGGAAAAPTQAQIDELLAAVPGYFSRAVISPDHRDATLAFGIRLMPLSRQQGVIDYIRSQLRPPAGVQAQVAGLPVLAAEANAVLSSSARRLLTLLAALLAVAAVLLVVLREPRRALVPLVPIALATGWSALILFLIGIPLNPMSATLGTLVIAISTEFSVLLSERYRQEREAGHRPEAALRRTLSSTGVAALASGVTAIAGFAVLVLSSITMLRDFGLVTLIDLTVSLAGVLVVLPAVLVLAERPEALASLSGLARRVSGPLRRARLGRAPAA